MAGKQLSRTKLSDKQPLALRALTEVSLSYELDPPAEYRLPFGTKVVSSEVWKDELFRCNALDREAGNPRRELRDSLVTRHLIGAREDWVWPVRSG